MSDPTAAMVIVGAGECGACAAISLREAGWTGRVVVFGDEPHLPYERPPLSKQHLTSDELDRPVTCAEASRFAVAQIEHRPNQKIVNIQPGERTVRSDTGESMGYERLLLATGARSRPLAVPGGDKAHLLRTHQDMEIIRAAIRANRRLVIIGGGLIGLELAASAIAIGATVTVVEAEDRLMKRAVPEPHAAILEDAHRQNGVIVRLNEQVVLVDENGIALANGERLQSDLTIAAIGGVPNTDIGERAGLTIDNGVATDAFLSTSDPAIFAAGDCAATLHPHFGDARRRCESWQVARDQGALAGRNMLGARETQTKAPWFWSDQYDLTLQVAGHADHGSRCVERKLSPTSTMLFFLDHMGVLVGASALGPLSDIGKDMMVCRRLIERQARPDPEVLVSPDKRLKPLLAA